MNASAFQPVVESRTVFCQVAGTLVKQLAAVNDGNMQ